MTAAAGSRIVIVDDEAPARARLRQLVGDLSGFEIIGEAGHGAEALNLCNELQPDVVLLDIRMPGIDGLEVAGHMAAWERRPAVVFTTAYDEYAIQAFEAQAVGYLLKPVRRERLQQTLEHAARVSRAQLVKLPGKAPRSHICVQRARTLQLIPVADIRLFQADQKYVTAHHTGGEALLSEPLKDLEIEFAEDFLRVHRNTLVAVSRVERLEKTDDGGWVVYVTGAPAPVQVSRRHVVDVKQRIRGRV